MNKEVKPIATISEKNLLKLVAENLKDKVLFPNRLEEAKKFFEKLKK